MRTVGGWPSLINGVGSYTFDAVGNRKTFNTTIPPAGGMTYNYADAKLQRRRE
jgi:hypothetical protein